MSTTVLATDNAIPKTSPAVQPQPKACAATAPNAVATTLCAIAPGISHAADREQFLDMELQADAEHEQDHADFRELLGEARVGHEARSMRPDENPAEQIPDNGREPEALRQVAENQGGRESTGERDNQIDAVHGHNCARSAVTWSLRKPQGSSTSCAVSSGSLVTRASQTCAKPMWRPALAGPWRL